jgi:CheY-like chemotaxis protein
VEGKIGVESAPGKGSTFWLTAQLEKRTSAVMARHAPYLDRLGTRVLVVDDDRTNRQILCNQIRAWKMQVDSATSGDEALDRLRTAVGEGQPYNVALMDVQMPKMDGMMLAAAIKGDSALADTRLILLTAMGHALRSTEAAGPHHRPYGSCLAGRTRKVSCGRSLNEEAERRKLALECKRAALEGQIAAMRAEFAAEEVTIPRIFSQDTQHEESVAFDRVAMGGSRQHDAVKSNRSADSPGHHTRKTFVITTDDWRNPATRHFGANSFCKPRRPSTPQFR